LIRLEEVGISSLASSMPYRWSWSASFAFLKAYSIVAADGRHPGRSGKKIEIQSSSISNRAGNV